jgi:sulfonate transport system substrate-binding protein
MPGLTPITRRIAIGVIALLATGNLAQPAAAEEIRIGYQKSSTLTAILKTNGELEKALAPLGVTISWHEFTSGLRATSATMWRPPPSPLAATMY